MNIDKLINNYYEFIKSSIKIREIDGYQEITTPLLDHFNDYIQVYVHADTNNNEIIITDDSYTLSNLKLGGLTFSDKRTALVKKLCTQFGVKQEDDEIYIHANKDDFGAKLDALLQCIVRVDDLCYTSRENVANFFNEDVKQFFKSKELYFTENISLIGKSGFPFYCDLSFQQTKKHPTRWVNIINRASKNNCITISFGWNDTSSTRDETEKMYVIINDKNPIDNGVIDGFKNLNITPVLWSEINKNLYLFEN